MTTYWLRFALKSDATFGRGDGIAGMIDSEVQHDAYGLPYLGGRALKGLLGEERANIIFSLKAQGKAQHWQETAQRLFGKPGSQDNDQSLLHICDAHLPYELCQAVKRGFDRNELKRDEILRSLTAIRQQTAMDIDGTPKKETLRSMRVILRMTPFEAALMFVKDPKPDDLAFLAACIKAFHRAGTGRNRGRGELEARLCDESGSDITQACFDHFQKIVLKEDSQ